MLLLLSLLFVGGLSSGVYTSLNNLKTLNNIENHMTKLLRNYMDGEKARIKGLETYYRYIKAVKEGIDADRYISYPTNQFSVILRFVSDWGNMERRFMSDNTDIATAHAMYRDYYPDEGDIRGAANALHRLQDIYKITAGHFARGEPLGDSKLSGEALNVKSLLTLASHAYAQHNWPKCAGWAQQAYSLMERNGDYLPDSYMWFEVTDYLSYCLFQAGKSDYAMEVIDTMLQHYPTNENLLKNKKFYITALQRQSEVKTKSDHGVADEDNVGFSNTNKEEADIVRVKRSVISDPLPFIGEIEVQEEVNITFVPKLYPGADQLTVSEQEIEDGICTTYFVERNMEKYNAKGLSKEDIDKYESLCVERMLKRYQSLCKEKAPLSPAIKAQVDQLTCYYKADTPRSRIKPIKTEVAWPSPRILIFHDIISDEEAVTLQHLAEPLLKRATVHVDERNDESQYRISKTAWLHNDLPGDKEDVVRRMNRRMEDATELSMEFAEAQQLNNYGMGGHYEPHYDMAMKYEKPIANPDKRVATILVYFGDTGAGGATIFVDAGVRLPPIKNAAVFWYNLLPNGDPDLLTRHAGCPVLAGTKWVMNKWVHVNDQMFTRPCDLDPLRREKDAKLRNGKYWRGGVVCAL